MNDELTRRRLDRQAQLEEQRELVDSLLVVLRHLRRLVRRQSLPMILRSFYA